MQPSQLQALKFQKPAPIDQPYRNWRDGTLQSKKGLVSDKQCQYCGKVLRTANGKLYHIEKECQVARKQRGY